VDDISQWYQICADTVRFTRAKRDQKQARKITSQTIKARDDHEDLSIHIVDNHSLHALRRLSGGWSKVWVPLNSGLLFVRDIPSALLISRLCSRKEMCL